ncbi:cardioacceleratory peptide receptor-like isoform X1 [Centruroides sculpturatus]|uniref:cardioacceleratory peptide receptor-like isoform X1 n=1 Tax=Centruroides sculpturatus TaxID=218467 RepID=UPI000C6E5A74|nr:cardioacceleratory peptide receptor-like isoform X1 [Centruroides sculpturatus]
MIVVGNTAVLVALSLSKNRKSRMNFFIMHLALADLTVGLINVLTDIIWRTTVAFYAGNVVCKLIKFLQVLVTYSSTYVLVALSIDRYDAITHPMNFSGSWKRARILVASAWSLSALLSIPAIFLNEEEFIRGRPQCWIDLNTWQWQMYITMVAISLFFIPALIISACYSIIVYTIWTKSKIMTYPKLSKSSHSSKDSAVKQKCIENELERKRTSSRGIIPKAKIKTVKMTFVIVFVFILCWSPYFIYDLLQVYEYIPENQTSIAVSTFIQSLAPLNSAANPIIYCLFSTRLCRNLRKLPLCNWLAGKLFICCPSMRHPNDTTFNRMSDFTTLTETSRSSTRATHRLCLHQRPNPVLKKYIIDKDLLKSSECEESTENSHV